MRRHSWLSWLVVCTASTLCWSSPVWSRTIHANLTASWPSSRLFPLVETSEFLAEESNEYFWKFVDLVSASPLPKSSPSHADNVDHLTDFAVQLAQTVASSSSMVPILELSLATRVYSIQVEMFRQLALDSVAKACGGQQITAWAIFYREQHCASHVACSLQELDQVLKTIQQDQTQTQQTCAATGVNDFELDADHVFPSTAAPTSNDDSVKPVTALVYGLVGEPELHQFHAKIKPLAKDGILRYMLRHYPHDESLETLLQGYGIALDIKNMEYKTIDDSKKSPDGSAATNNAEEEDDEEEEEIGNEEEMEDDVEGFLFARLIQRNPQFETELKRFRDILVSRHQEDDIKAWHLQDLGLVATREIVDAKNPLEKLRRLSQDFPKYAKKLAFSKKEITQGFRDNIASQRHELAQRGFLNKFYLNGMEVNPLQYSFNIFDFFKHLKRELLVSEKLQQLDLPPSERTKMLQEARELSGSSRPIRVSVRGQVDGSAPFYVNNIETDEATRQWPNNIKNLRRYSWQLIFLRRNMYEFAVVFDPMTATGLMTLGQMSVMRMRGAPFQFAFLVSSEELLSAVGDPDVSHLNDLLSKYKAMKDEEPANAWHFAKLLFLARSKEIGEESKQVVAPFLDSVSHETAGMSIQKLMECYMDATGGTFGKGKNKKEAREILNSDKFDAEVLSMTQLILAKHLPMECTLFNGVLRRTVDLQDNIMTQLGRDQELYQALARRDELEDEVDLISQLMSSEETYPSFFSLFDENNKKTSHGSSSSSKLLFRAGVEHKLKQLLNKHVTYLHGPDSLTVAKKQTLLAFVNLNDPIEAGHALELVKATLEDSDKSLRVGVVHRFDDDSAGHQVDDHSKAELILGLLQMIGKGSDKEIHLRMIMEALNAVKRKKSLDGVKQKIRVLLGKHGEEEAFVQRALALLDKRAFVDDETAVSLRRLAHLIDDSESKAKSGSSPLLFINQLRVELPKQASILTEDVLALLSYDNKHRTQVVAKSFLHHIEHAESSVEQAAMKSDAIVDACGVVDQFLQTPREEAVELPPNESVVIRQEGDPSLMVTAYVEPLSEAAQTISSLLLLLHDHFNATIELVPVPRADYGEFPLKRFYRYLFDTKKFTNTRVEFTRLPIKPLLTMKIDTPEAWNVQAHRTSHDLDNLRVDPDNAADVKSTKSAEYRLKSLLVYGQCLDVTGAQYTPPNGLQLVLQREIADRKMHRDTLVMRNLGYFQLQATPGVWRLELARGRALELFEMVDVRTEMPLEHQHLDVQVHDFGSSLKTLFVRKREGMEFEELLAMPTTSTTSRSKKSQTIDKEEDEEEEPVWRSYWDSFVSMFDSKHGSTPKEETTSEVAESTQDDAVMDPSSLDESSISDLALKKRSGETIHVFSLASGHLYERFIKIMMLSVLKRTNNPVTFWLLENFLSPDFKNSLPALKDQFGMDIRLVTYKWPNWLRQQTEKQRIIWGYKILFLDVLFPLDVKKIIYVDADQVVRSDLKELWEMDLQNHVYGYTPFCASRNVGFQFWRQGYWKDHLRGKPYHISALYVVDLAMFRLKAAGDHLRAVYDQLSADPNSLSNLDQDLPNYTQHEIPIFSLPQEWLWCESWCSDESKGAAKTIDLCNNPKHKEPKLDMAKRVISGELFQESWIELDQEIRDAESRQTVAAV